MATERLQLFDRLKKGLEEGIAYESGEQNLRVTEVRVPEPPQRSANEIDLWPEDLRVPEDDSPAMVLRRQAKRLGEHTRGRVEADVLTQPLPGGKIAHNFSLKGAALGGYTHTLLKAIHQKKPPYPVEVEFTLAAHAKEVQVYKCSSQEELEQDLRTIFADVQTRRMIDSLLAA